jgi:ABC-type multidrug transport system fused ATPase/permease subunit
LSLAQVIQRNPELLNLDEATIAVDSQSELLVQEAIKRFEHNHTVLVIAQRLSTIAAADQILVPAQGRVVERSRPWMPTIRLLLATENEPNPTFGHSE